MKHLVIIDGHHLMYRAYWAIPRNMRTSTGVQINAVFGMASMLISILKAERPDSLLLCFDADEKTFRHIQYDAYKEGRSPTPDDFYTQIPAIFTLMDTFGFKRVEGGGFEADDFACSYAHAAAKSGMRATVVSGDRDLLQLASDHIRIAVPHKGYQMPEYFGAEQVLAKYGVRPDQMTSYKGMVGDSSDNLPGVKGIGPKAASALLQQFATLEDVYAHLADVKPSWRSKLEAEKKQAFFCKQMSELRCDIALPIPLAELALTGLPSDSILHAFQQLEFTLLSKRLRALLDEPYGKEHFQPPPAAVADIPSVKKASKAAASEARASSQLSLL